MIRRLNRICPLLALACGPICLSGCHGYSALSGSDRAQAKGAQKHLDLIGTWLGQPEMPATWRARPENRRAWRRSVMRNPRPWKWTLTLNDDGTFTQHVENHVMMTLIA